MTKIQRARRQVRLSRSLGIALTPKAQRLFEKRPYGPGEHGRDRRRAESDYAVRLREKQRLRAQYGISENSCVLFMSALPVLPVRLVPLCRFSWKPAWMRWFSGLVLPGLQLRLVSS